jgi:hypothetical protein
MGQEPGMFSQKPVQKPAYKNLKLEKVGKPHHHKNEELLQ